MTSFFENHSVEDFRSDFVKDLAGSMGIDTARIQVVAVAAGSIKVHFKVRPGEGLGANEVLDSLKTQQEAGTLAGPYLSRTKKHCFILFATKFCQRDP